MSDNSGSEKDLTELTDEEIRELSQEFTEVIPETMAKATGMEDFTDIGGDFEEELHEKVEGMFIEFRDALQHDSDKKKVTEIFDFGNKVVRDTFMDEEDMNEFEGNSEFNWLVSQLEIIIENNRNSLEKIGYVEYFDIVSNFAADIVKAGQAQEVKEFYDGLDDSYQQSTLQRLIDPVIMEYYEYIEDNSEIKNPKQARQYIEMYYEIAELFTDVLPQFIAVLQIVDTGEHNYDDLKDMGLNNLLQKLGSKKYERFNELMEGIDRELRNSIAHRDFTVDPVEKEIEFRDRGELVAEMDYHEFQNEFFNILSLFNSIWAFQLLLSYYQFENLCRAMDELEYEPED